MRLLDTETGQFVEKDPEKWEDMGRMVYAILSHTWDEAGEQTYGELRDIQRRYEVPRSQEPQNNPTVPELPNDSESPSVTACPPTAIGRLTQSEVKALRAFVEAYGLANFAPAPALSGAPSLDPQPKLPPQSIWDDPEMYKWYSFAKVCYAYLADVPPGEVHHAEESAFHKSRWFRRGWTLQELIAPLIVEFLSKDWAPIGSKHALADLVESVTKIDYRALLHLEPLDTFSVAQRLSWAANRKTTRVEDRAYSLLGLFNINMPTLYGEGDRAFRRLQVQIMQRIPDQSLFAWGDVYVSSELTKNRDFADTSKGLRAEVQQYNHDEERWNLLAMSPDRFKDCKHINTPRNTTSPLLSHLSRHEIEYTSTPYGVRTQFWMIHLTQDLHSLRICLHSTGVQLEFPDLPESSQWYVAILKCEHQEQPGHPLGRVCYMSPSETNIQSMHAGYIWVTSPQGKSLCTPPDLLPLSPETIEHCRPQTELKTVYIPPPDRDTLSVSSRLQDQPYTAIMLVLLRTTRDALRSRGYSADIRGPDLDHPTMHWFTLSKDEHTITIEFQHTLRLGGRAFTIDAEVRMSGSHIQLHSAPDSDQADRHTVSWWDEIEWETELDDKKVRLSAAGAGTLTVDLRLAFAGLGYYVLRADVLSDAPPASSAVDPAVNQEEEGERN
ncbi:hypothetical protein V8D89_001017, partial [Ganoderma adspersum]